MEKVHFFTTHYLFNRTCRLIDQLVHTHKPSRALDVPAGAGALTQYLIERHGLDVCSAEIDTSKWTYSKGKCLYANLARELPYPDQHFDLVVCLEGLKHVSDVQTALSELSRVLKKNGHLLVTIPNDLCMQSRLRYFFDGFVDTDWIHPMQTDSEDAKQFMHLGSLLSLPYLKYFAQKCRLKILSTTHDRLRFWSLLFALPAYPFLLFFKWRACKNDRTLFRQMISLTWIAGRRNLVVFQKYAFALVSALAQDDLLIGLLT